MAFKITIDDRLTEQKLVEGCLNLSSSGYNSTLGLMLYALKERWHVDKLSYYLKLIQCEESGGAK